VHFVVLYGTVVLKCTVKNMEKVRKNLSMAKPRQKAEPVFKRYKLFVYRDIRYSNNLFTETNGTAIIYLQRHTVQH
jgi:hypothetical protein